MMLTSTENFKIGPELKGKKIVFLDRKCQWCKDVNSLHLVHKFNVILIKITKRVLFVHFVWRVEI